LLTKSLLSERDICRCGHSNKKIGYDGYSFFNMPGTACESRDCNNFRYLGIDLVLASSCRKFYFLFPCGSYYEIKTTPVELLNFIKENYSEYM
jgi:hypothetical protein